jgi:hypothetical protein
VVINTSHFSLIYIPYAHHIVVIADLAKRLLKKHPTTFEESRQIVLETSNHFWGILPDYSKTSNPLLMNLARLLENIYLTTSEESRQITRKHLTTCEESRQITWKHLTTYEEFRGGLQCDNSDL